MKNIVYFGEEVAGYDIRVLNEREARAAAGILFLFAVIAFSNAWFAGNFIPLKMAVIAFLTDFLLRVVVNPKYAPSMILGRFFVSKQKPEYTGAPQKKFAWGIGLILAVTMFIIVVVFDVRGPLNLAICLLCLTFLYFEAVFGICIGCKMYNLIKKEKAKLCPGGVCEFVRKEEIQKISLAQVAVVIVFILIMMGIAYSPIIY